MLKIVPLYNKGTFCHFLLDAMMIEAPMLISNPHNHSEVLKKWKEFHLMNKKLN